MKMNHVIHIYGASGSGTSTLGRKISEELGYRFMDTDDLEENFKKARAEINSVIGRTVTITVDRPLGSYHPEHKDMYYPINYGYVEGVMASDGEEQDAYILGLDVAVEKFTGTIIAVVHRNDDVEEKWVVVPKGMTFTKEEIRKQVDFQEQYFDSEIVM